eukprot:GHVN01036296.1.p1 GENE.GHVN01036296.1~~GHVN01036296.1.p1  ORF type:complete len:102 (+),score=9.76 GHVN01036296.1:49-354(+)
MRDIPSYSSFFTHRLHFSAHPSGPGLALRESALPTVIPPDLFDGERNKFDGLTSRTFLGDYDTTNNWLAQNSPLLSSSPSTLGPLVARRAMSRNKSRRNRP